MNWQEESKAKQESYAMAMLAEMTELAVRRALSHLPAESIAMVLDDLANAIRNPGDVAENLSPISGGYIEEL